jgi:hypothetical protein
VVNIVKELNRFFYKLINFIVIFIVAILLFYVLSYFAHCFIGCSSNNNVYANGLKYKTNFSYKDECVSYKSNIFIVLGNRKKTVSIKRVDCLASFLKNAGFSVDDIRCVVFSGRGTRFYNKFYESEYMLDYFADHYFQLYKKLIARDVCVIVENKSDCTFNNVVFSLNMLMKKGFIYKRGCVFFVSNMDHVFGAVKVAKKFFKKLGYDKYGFISNDVFFIKCF